MKPVWIRTYGPTLLVAVFAITGSAFAAEAADEVSSGARAAASITTDEIAEHIGALSDDTFEGREAGSRGGRAAGVYIGRRLRDLGVAGAGDDGGYYQPFNAGYRNILARIDGVDPELRDEVILIGAHYDHVGYGNAQNSYGPTGFIHNGADDNASGTAALLEVIEAIVEADVRTRRSIVFAFWDGEEKGLLGSIHWVAQPTVPLSQLKLAINMDMVGRLRAQGVEVSGIRSASGLRSLVSRQNDATDLVVDFTWEVNENSDHFSFFERRIPFVMMHTGLHDDYHRPSDDAHLINHEGASSVTRLVLLTLLAAADADLSYAFRSEAQRETPNTQRVIERPLPALPGRLGIRWSADGTTEDGRGVRIRDVRDGSAAALAGLRVGDVVLQFDGVDVRDGDHLKSLVAIAPTTVAAVIQRGEDSDSQDVAIELTGRPFRLGISWRTDDADPGVLVVSRVVSGTPADRAGIRVHDRIYDVDGKPLGPETSLGEIVSERAGPMEFLVERVGQLRRITVDLPTPESGEPERADVTIAPGPE